MNKRTFFKNTVIMTGTSVLLRTLGIVFRIFISNRVGAEGMGLYQLVFSVYVLGTAFAAAGLSTAVTRMVTEQMARKNRAAVHRIMKLSVSLAVMVGTVSAILLYVGAPQIGKWIGDERTVAAIRISGISLPFIGISGCLRGYFTALRKMEAPSLSQLIAQIIRIGGTLLLLYRDGDTLEKACRAILLGDALSETVACIFLAGAFFRDKRSRAQPVTSLLPMPPLWGPMLKIALPLTAGQYLSTALRTVENILVPLQLTHFTGTRELALKQFGSIKGMALPILFFPAALLITVSNLLIPELTEAYALGYRREVSHLTERALNFTLPGAVLLGCVFTVMGKEIGNCLYHDAAAGVFLQILGPLAPIMYLDSVSSSLLRGLGQQVRSLWYGIADSAVRLVLIFLLLPGYGITGFLFVMLVSNLLTSLLTTNRLLTVSATPMHWGRWVFAPLLTAILAGSTWIFLRSRLPMTSGILRLGIGTGATALLYILMLPLFGGASLFSIRQKRRISHSRR